jgi:hypothetical protein
VTSDSDESKIQFLTQCLKKEDIHIVCKALHVLGKLAEKNWSNSQYLYKMKIVKIAKTLILKCDPSITRETCYMIS